MRFKLLLESINFNDVKLFTSLSDSLQVELMNDDKII